MGGGASARRYLGGMKPEKYFRTVCWVELEETLTILGFSYDNAMKIFEAFIEIDADNSAEMSVDEFHKYLGQDVTKFSERVFGILDTDGSGMLNFKGKTHPDVRPLGAGALTHDVASLLHRRIRSWCLELLHL